MQVPFYDIQAQYTDLASEIDQVVHDVISSGNYVLGNHNRAFEEEFARLHQVKHAIAVHSGTDALRIMMDAAEIGPGDEVITTAFTFVASVETIVQTGATPVFVDIDPATFMMDPAKIEAAITPKTKAILPIHLFGQLYDVVRIGEIAQKHGLVVLEDAAQAIESTFDGKPAGHFGISAGFSFYVTKNLGAAGDGGMITTNDDETNERCRSIRVHGMGRERYYYDHLGYTARLDEIQAAVLRVKMTKLGDWGRRKVAIGQRYLNELNGIDGLVLPVTSPGNNHTFHQFTVRAKRRDALQSHLKDLGVPSMIYYPVPIHHHKPYLKFAPSSPLSVTEEVSNEVLSLPIHPHLSDEQVSHVIDSVQKFF
ncbi:MAG: DegT/DnrJ/EryC1/StrS family aminotransferase [Armatimonadetes bacterium]|nr:DegT/DnrJ/EryC1/StrS family aminotransferase [Armatimonadota bacterium]